MKKRAVLLIFLSFILPQIVLAVGISPPEYNANMIYGQSQEFQFYAINTMNYPMNIQVSAGSEFLNPYMTIDNDLLRVDPNEWKPFKVKIHYPTNPLKPGIHEVKISVTEKREESGTITARASVTGRIYIREEYPGLHAEAKIKTENKNLDETVPIEIILHNYGTDVISKATGYADIIFDGEKVKTLELSSVENITTHQSKTMYAQFNTIGSKPGKYTINATISYDEKTTTVQGEFKLGTLHVGIIDFTKQVYQNKINPFEIIIESKWNEKISNIFADVNVIENNSIATSFRTISKGLEKWEQNTIVGHLNTEGLSLGMHDVEIYLNYEGFQTIEKGKINITKEILPETEEPKQSKFPVYLIALVIVLTMIIIFLILIKRKKSGGEKEIFGTY